MANLVDRKIFTKLDLVRAFHHILIIEQDIAKTEVILLSVFYEFVVMSFGL